MSGGRLRGALASLLADRAEYEARQERRVTARSGCTAVVQLPDRSRARVSGVLRSVTLRARENVPALEAELFDGSGSVRLVWLGQRRIAGIDPGRRLRLDGMVCTMEGVRTMFNPRYELVGDDDGA